MKKYQISYSKGCFLQLSSKYQQLCCLHKENKAIPKLLNGNVSKRYEDMYDIFIDKENGTLVFTHNILITVGAASTGNVECAKVISFDTVKELLVYEIEFYKTLVEKWKNENDKDRAESCKKQLLMLEKISNTNSEDWRTLI